MQHAAKTAAGAAAVSLRRRLATYELEVEFTATFATQQASNTAVAALQASGGESATAGNIATSLREGSNSAQFSGISLTVW